MNQSKPAPGRECKEPSLIDPARLRYHFRTVYKLNDDQVELMVRSSAKSLRIALAAAEKALKETDIRAPLVEAGHSLKGLFLNMGEGEWAEVARTLERVAKTGKEQDCISLVGAIRQGVVKVVEYDTGS